MYCTLYRRSQNFNFNPKICSRAFMSNIFRVKEIMVCSLGSYISNETLLFKICQEVCVSDALEYCLEKPNKYQIDFMNIFFN